MRNVTKLSNTIQEPCNPSHIETSQLICRANQLTGFYMRGAVRFFSESDHFEALYIKALKTFFRWKYKGYRVNVCNLTKLFIKLIIFFITNCAGRCVGSIRTSRPLNVISFRKFSLQVWLNRERYRLVRFFCWNVFGYFELRLEHLQGNEFIHFSIFYWRNEKFILDSINLNYKLQKVSCFSFLNIFVVIKFRIKPLIEKLKR